MKFSVLMPVYIKENPMFLDEALKSILIDQSVTPNEILLVKDGPLTSTLNEIIDTYLEDFPDIIKVISLKENVGLGKALNIGVKNCTYNTIARMDSDDISRKDRFEIMISEFEKDTTLSIIGSHIDEFEGDIGNVISTRKVPISHQSIYKFAKRRNPFNHMSVMFKKDAILSVGNYMPANGFEDYYLWARLLVNGFKGKNIDDSLVYARIGVDMFNRRGGFKYLKSAIQAKWKIRKLGLSNNVDFLISSASHLAITLMPNSWRGFIYKKILRK